MQRPPTPTDAAAARRRGRPRKRLDAAIMAGPRVVRANLHEQAAERLRDLIVRGDLAPGASLVEVELSGMLGISRTPIREAIKLLAQQGLVELRANRSPCVRPLRAAEIRELFEALAGIERIAAELAAQRITAADLGRLRALQAEIVREHEAGRRDSYAAANRTIHRTIVLAARNAPLAEVHAALLSRADQVRVFALGLEDRWEQSIREHQAILDALDARDPVQAGRLLQEHVGQTAAVVAASLAGRTDPASSAA
ncbi:GntR family transcriptional regulator [Methylobacterium sp.]|uniref:GntR family transcriptional regulator n=1 Tax=Methylobacterium sp. TaxID=409 RepID=UPI0025882DBE|nr:GntR family transcriptional regulator [Methylobacterium sp.]